MLCEILRILRTAGLDQLADILEGTDRKNENQGVETESYPEQMRLKMELLDEESAMGNTENRTSMEEIERSQQILQTGTVVYVL